MQTSALVQAIDTELQTQRFADYAPNGLQVQGRDEVRTLVTGVTACRALIEAAAAHDACALLVHHGLFWRGHDGRLTGWLRERVALLLAHNINLLAWHLPLDAHPTLGNNAQLARVLGFGVHAQLGPEGLLFTGAPAQPFEDVQQLAAHVARALGRAPVCAAGDGRGIARLAWCSGGAQGQFEAAIAAGADAFLTGEISEPQAHLARECGVAFLACGHHATERYGVQALGAHLAAQHDLRHIHIDIDNPA